MGGEGRLYTGYGNDGKREKASFSPPSSRIKYMGLKIRDVHERTGHARAPFSLPLSITILLCAQKLLRYLCQ